MPQFPIKMKNGAGGIISGHLAIICSGIFALRGGPLGDCYSLTSNKQWIKIESLKEPRYKMSIGNLVIDGKLWISGGMSSSSRSASTELVDLQSTSIESTNMPFDDNGHCSIQLDNNRIMTTGGSSGADKYSMRSETHILDTRTGTWTVGPRLNSARYDHACGKVKIGDKWFIFVTGGLVDGYTMVSQRIRIAGQSITMQTFVMKPKTKGHFASLKPD